jgi:putative aldouronate transport system permease protein
MYKRIRLDSETGYQILITIFVFLLAVTMIFPLIYVLGTSLTSQHELLLKNYFVIVPDHPTITAYKRILSNPIIYMSLAVSFLRSASGTVLSLSVMLAGAFVLSRKSLPGRKLFLIMILATILFQGGLIPNYYVVRQMGMINKFWALIIPPLIDSFGLLVIKVFIENMPDSLLESIQLDGAGEMQQLVYIIAPLTGPVLAAIGMFTAVNHWNWWFDALIYITNNKKLYPLQLVLRNMMLTGISTNDLMNAVLQDSEKVSRESIKMATVIVGVLPILMIYPFLQKYFINGIYMGSVKG